MQGRKINTCGGNPPQKGANMTNSKIKEAIEQAQYEANAPKGKLMSIIDDLYEAGAIRKAKSLETIVEKLEKWQQ